MEKIVVNGGIPLSGRVEISGMKNAAVAVIFATVLTGGVSVIENLPNISDVRDSLMLIESIGARVRMLSRTTAEIDTSSVTDREAPYDTARKMRASYYLAGAMLARFGRARVGLPGGCDFGVRPIDLHEKAFARLGADVCIRGGFLEADAAEGLTGNSIYLDCASVGATVNAMLAATAATGTTILENAAREPHIVDLAGYLCACGADIRGAGTPIIRIKGGKPLHGANHSVIPDMIEAGTFMIAAAATDGRLYITNVIPKHLSTISEKLREMGVSVEEFDEAVMVSRGEEGLSSVNVKTLPYPGFPTDMNPQMTVLLSLANGDSRLSETVWSGRFRYIDELQRMGADIRVEDRAAYIRGVGALTGASVKAVDLRAGAAMVIAALAAKGHTEIEEIGYIERGYDNIVEKLRAVGADIHKENISDGKEKRNIG